MPIIRLFGRLIELLAIIIGPRIYGGQLAGQACMGLVVETLVYDIWLW
jgi:hypothetical protein